MEKNKKIQAAIAGVMYYMQSEEEQRPALPEAMPTTSGASAWAMNGRQTIMQWRGLVQARVLKR